MSSRFRSPLVTVTGAKSTTSTSSANWSDGEGTQSGDISEVTAWQNEMDTLEQTQMKIQVNQNNLMSSQIQILMREIGDLQKQVACINTRIDTQGESLGSSIEDLADRIETAMEEAHAALRLELAEHGNNAAETKAAMEEAHLALATEMSQRHAEHAEVFSTKESLEETHAQNAERFEARLNEALGKTHTKLQEELKLLKGGGVHNLGDLGKIMADVTQQVDSLDRALRQEHELRMAVEARMDKMFNDQDKVVCQLHRDLKSALDESHAALKLELAEHGKNSIEVKAAMYEAHKALQNEHSRVTGDLANKLDSHGQAHSASLADLENKLRSDLKRNSHEIEARHRDLKAANTKNEVNHSTLDQRIHLLELSCNSKCDDTFKEVQAAHAKIQDLHMNTQNYKSKSDLAHAGSQERLETLERQLKERIQTHDALQGKVQGESLTREKGMSTFDARLTKLEALLHESTERQGKDVEGASSRVREVLSKLEQQRSSLEGHKAIVDQRLSYLDKAVLEAQDTHSQAFAQALSSLHNDHSKELSYALQAERSARESQEKTFLDFIQDSREQKEAFEQTMQEQIRLERVAREVQWNQLKDSIAIKERMWHGGNSEYADILLQEHSARETVERSIEHRVDSVEHNLQIERSERTMEVRRLWDALDTHTHDATGPSLKTVEVKTAEAKPAAHRVQPEPIHVERHLVISPRASLTNLPARVINPLPERTVTTGIMTPQAPHDHVHVERHLVMSPRVNPPIVKKFIVEPPLRGSSLVAPMSGCMSPPAGVRSASIPMSGSTLSRMASQGTVSVSTPGSSLRMRTDTPN